MHLTSLVLPALCLGVAIGVTTAQTCDNGLAGVSNGIYCCTLGCGTCGGVGCSTREGLDGDDCCTVNIAANGIQCADSGAAPCMGDVDVDVLPTAMPTVAETMGSSYLGCFSDLEDARIFTFQASTAAMTADACLALCAGSTYYGTQFSEECWCGAEGADYDAHGASDACTTACAGDADEICGGFYAMSVYENDVVDGGEIVDPSYLGCFSDPADNRVFVQDISSDVMTAEVCSEACAGSAYYGTQFSTECWCGAEGADYDANGASDACTMSCAGNMGEICGGFYAMSVYQNDVDDGEIVDPSYLGCYSDPADNRVFVQDISSDAMTAEVCSEACAGSAYYGTQFSTECWCGAEGADYDVNGASDACTMSCAGDADEFCGGFYAMSVYQNDVDDVDEEETDDSSYLGCYSDPADNRVFVQDISSDAMTAEVCSEACAGSAYYGTQFSTECWCGAEGADYDANGEGVCDMACGGDVEEICGGFYAMSVYENGADDGEPVEFSCSGDAGVSSGTSCCEADCGTCGGTGCSTRAPGAASCCVASIQLAGILCSDSGAAPCIL